MQEASTFFSRLCTHAREAMEGDPVFRVLWSQRTCLVGGRCMRSGLLLVRCVSVYLEPCRQGHSQARASSNSPVPATFGCADGTPFLFGVRSGLWPCRRWSNEEGSVLTVPRFRVLRWWRMTSISIRLCQGRLTPCFSRRADGERDPSRSASQNLVLLRSLTMMFTRQILHHPRR